MTAWEAQRERTQRRKRELIKLLGGACDECGKRHTKLEVDHPHGRSWEPRDLSWTSRVARYWKEYQEGVELRCLCRSCNGSDGALRFQGTKKRQAREAAGDVVPF